MWKKFKTFIKESWELFTENPYKKHFELQKQVCEVYKKYILIYAEKEEKAETYEEKIYWLLQRQQMERDLRTILGKWNHDWR